MRPDHDRGLQPVARDALSHPLRALRRRTLNIRRGAIVPLPSRDLDTLRYKRGPMSAFSEAEIAYLRSQRLGRLATVGPDSQPHVVPVGFRYNAEHDAIE